LANCLPFARQVIPFFKKIPRKVFDFFAEKLMPMKLFADADAGENSFLNLAPELHEA
jgi:hypothetical protein